VKGEEKSDPQRCEDLDASKSLKGYLPGNERQFQRKGGEVCTRREINSPGPRRNILIQGNRGRNSLVQKTTGVEPTFTMGERRARIGTWEWNSEKKNLVRDRRTDPT